MTISINFFQEVSLSTRLTVHDVKSDWGKVLLFKVDMLISPGNEMTFGFTNVRQACITQTSKFVDNIWYIQG